MLQKHFCNINAKVVAEALQISSATKSYISQFFVYCKQTPVYRTKHCSDRFQTQRKGSKYFLKVYS